MKIIDSISLAEIKALSTKMYPNLVKAGVDINKNVVAIDAEYHVDLEQMLLEQDSAQKDLWGINFHPDKFGLDGFVEFDSMINLRPSQNNETRGVADPNIRAKIIDVVLKKITQ